MIFNGKLLTQDNQTLKECGLFDNCVLHCYIGEPQSETSPSNSNNTSNRALESADDINLSEILVSHVLLIYL